RSGQGEEKDGGEEETAFYGAAFYEDIHEGLVSGSRPDSRALFGESQEDRILGEGNLRAQAFSSQPGGRRRNPKNPSLSCDDASLIERSARNRMNTFEESPMSTRKAALIAALTVSCFGFAAASPARAQYFGVDTSAQTLGYIGTYSDNSGWLVNHTSASSLSDPAGATLSATGYGTAFADVGAGSHAEQGLLHAWASGHTNRVSGGNSFPGAAPYGYGYAHFTDRLTVTSSTLSAGTKVMIVFGNVVDRTTWTYSGLYDGYIDMRVQIGVATAMSRWTANYLYGDTA